MGTRPQHFRPPFNRNVCLLTQLSELERQTLSTGRLLGYPRVKTNERNELVEFLEKEFCSSDMERMSPFLWLMSMQSHENISPLHRQKLKGRYIVVTEDPKLHLTWIDDRVFLKPLPRYLCTHDFWVRELSGPTIQNDARRRRIRTSALGYLRTWFYLIRHESDFRIAQTPELQLIPEPLSWDQFCEFSGNLWKIENPDVCERYHFGELRLARLNFYAKFVLRKWSYQRMYRQYGDYFARFYGPLLFVFASFSVTLSAMQVVMSVEQIASGHWTYFWGICRWVSIVCIVLIVAVLLGLFALLAFKLYGEWKRAIMDRQQRRHSRRIHTDLESQATVHDNTEASEVHPAKQNL